MKPEKKEKLKAEIADLFLRKRQFLNEANHYSSKSYGYKKEIQHSQKEIEVLKKEIEILKNTKHRLTQINDNLQSEIDCITNELSKYL